MWFQTLMLFLLFFFPVKHKKKNFMQLFFELNYQLSSVSHTKLSYEVRRHMVYFYDTYIVLFYSLTDRWMEIAV